MSATVTVWMCDLFNKSLAHVRTGDNTYLQLNGGDGRDKSLAAKIEDHSLSLFLSFFLFRKSTNICNIDSI